MSTGISATSGSPGETHTELGASPWLTHRPRRRLGLDPFWASRSGPNPFLMGLGSLLPLDLTCIPMLLPLPGEGSGADMLPQSSADRWMDFCDKNPSRLEAAAEVWECQGTKRSYCLGLGMTGARVLVCLGNRMCSRHPLTTDWLGAAGESLPWRKGSTAGLLSHSGARGISPRLLTRGSVLTITVV